MIAHPLDLASRLRQPPRSFDTLFYVNVGALALFFVLFGSRFVLAPGLQVGLWLPEAAAGHVTFGTADCYVSVLNSGLIYGEDGLLNAYKVGPWLKDKATAVRNPKPTILIRGDAGVPLSQISDIVAKAREAGFAEVIVAEEPRARPHP